MTRTAGPPAAFSEGKGYVVHRPTGIGASLMLALTGLALAVLLAPVAAFGADQVVKVSTTAGPYIPLDCKPCHANIADNKLPDIKFSHAAHLVYDCTACHPTFPHQPEGTTKPGKRECWNCHALRHGPQGIIAKAECTKCHVDDATKRRPGFHTPDWAGKPHVQPGLTKLQTQCMMCHDQKWCEDCHIAKHIYWVPEKPYVFDSANGCLACHGAVLPRLEGVVNLDPSAHRTAATCQECHPDFKYDDSANQTNLWKVNAGLACQKCHEKDDPKNPERVAYVKQYQGSYHQTKFQEGRENKKINAPLCADCHGGHGILRTKTQAAQRALYLSSATMCGSSGCHAKEFANYSDAYHGAAYKSGALDAPACWTCHGGHAVFKSTDPTSAVNLEKRGATCSKGADGTATFCHAGSGESFAAAGGAMIHTYDDVRAANPVQKVLSMVFGK